MTITEEITLPGFKSDVHAFGYQLANFSPVPAELELGNYGFELIHPEISFSHVFPKRQICRNVSVHRKNNWQHQQVFNSGWQNLEQSV